MISLIKVTLRNKNFINYTECKRFAGHSKWANIRHIKMSKDGQKKKSLDLLLRRLRIAIAEGKSANPDLNPELTRLIEQAKKQSMSLATIKNILEKEQNAKTLLQSAYFESKGPLGCVILIHLLSENTIRTKHLINNHLKKSLFSPCDSPCEGTYDQKGIVLTEIGNLSLDKALEDAIEVGAEDVEQIKEEDKEFFQFICHPVELLRVNHKLEKLNYKIIEAENVYIPKALIKLSDEEMELISKLYDKLNTVEEIVKIYTNIS